jgi:hypothetical protein
MLQIKEKESYSTQIRLLKSIWYCFLGSPYQNSPNKRLWSKVDKLDPKSNEYSKNCHPFKWNPWTMDPNLVGIMSRWPVIPSPIPRGGRRPSTDYHALLQGRSPTSPNSARIHLPGDPVCTLHKKLKSETQIKDARKGGHLWYGKMRHTNISEDQYWLGAGQKETI